MCFQICSQEAACSPLIGSLQYRGVSDRECTVFSYITKMTTHINYTNI